MIRKVNAGSRADQSGYYYLRYPGMSLPSRRPGPVWPAVSSASESLAPGAPNLTEERDRLRRENEQLAVEVRVLELKVQKLQRQLWDKKSERVAPDDGKQRGLFEEPAAEAVAPARAPAGKNRDGEGKERVRKGPKPLDPALPREVIAVPAPDLAKLICPVTGKPMQPGFIEQLEVLARRPPEYYVKHYERTVFVSPANTAPVYSPWPADVLPRARMHASVVAHIAAAHYCEHTPFHRLEQQLARVGVDLPRVCQVSLMDQLNQLVEPLLVALKKEVFSSGYVQVDATPLDLCDPARPGRVREATLWAYRTKLGAVWFEYQTSKSPVHPDATLKAMKFRGFCQTVTVQLARGDA